MEMWNEKCGLAFGNNKLTLEKHDAASLKQLIGVLKDTKSERCIDSVIRQLYEFEIQGKKNRGVPQIRLAFKLYLLLVNRKHYDHVL